MTSSINLKKIISVGAAALLAIGGTVVAAEPAFAATSITWDAGTGATMDANSQQTYVQSVTTGTPMSTAPAATKTGCVVERWQEWRSGMMFSNVNFPYTPSGATLDIRAQWSCPNTLVTAPTAVLSGSVITLTPGVWSTTPDFGEWKMCGLAVTSGSSSNGYFNNNAGGCDALYTTSTGTRLTSTTVNLSTTYYRSGGQVANLIGYKLVWVEFGSSTGIPSYFANTAGISISSIPQVQPPSSGSERPLTPEQARNQIKPLPVIVQPLVAAIPVLSKPMVNAGGKLDLSAGDFSGLVSASISGKPLDLTLGAKGGLTITVPNGEAGKTADLFLKFTSGTVIIQDAIKYVAPVVVADVPTRPVSIAAGSTKLSQATADQVRQAAFANMKNTTVSCVAYAANGSAAARAAAQATAEQVCALATKSNPALTATPVIVIVDKAKAKTEAVGIKVYKN